MAELGGRQVMVAGALIPEGFINYDEIRRLPQGRELPGWMRSGEIGA
jgi:hypothetical protein